MVEQRGNVRVESSQKRVRAYLDGELVADTTRPMWSGRSRTTRPTTSRWGRPRRAARADGATALAEPGRRDYFTSRSAARAATPRGATPTRRSKRCAPHPPRLGRDGRLVRGGRGGVRPPPQTRTPASTPAQLPPRAGGDRRRDRGRVARPRSCSRPACRRATTCPRPTSGMDLLTPTGTDVPVPVQGDRRATGRSRSGARRARHRVVLPGAAARKPARSPAWSAFYNEKVDLCVDGELETRPTTPFS